MYVDAHAQHARPKTARKSGTVSRFWPKPITEVCEVLAEVSEVLPEVTAVRGPGWGVFVGLTDKEVVSDETDTGML